MLRILLSPALAASLVASAGAQVAVFFGPSPNLPTPNLDFDNPFVPTGPINGTDPAFINAGLTSVSLITNTGWTDTGGTIYESVAGQSLITQGGSLAVGGAVPGTPLERPGDGDGWEISFASPVDEFQCIMTDQGNQLYDIELLNGGVSIGTGGPFSYPGDNRVVFFRGTGPFDTIRITFPIGAGDLGIDEWAWGNGPYPQPPANDDCANATPVTLGSNVFSNLFATNGAPASSCDGEVDVWYSFTAPAAGNYRFDTCGSVIDTVLDVYSGSCGSLVLEGCNDDTCSWQSRVDVTGVNAGETLLIQVGGYDDEEQGIGNLEITAIVPPPPPPPTCCETLFESNNGGATGGAVYFDMTLSQPSSFDGMLTNTGAPSGSGIGVSVWTCTGSYAGQETDPGAWTLVAEDDGSAISLGDDEKTPISFLAPFSLPAGLTGIAIVGQNPTTGAELDHEYTNGNGVNQNFSSADGVVTLDLGTASSNPFTGSIFSPRVWNGRFCHGGAPLGTNYCQAAVNSTGGPARMSASGSNIVADNDLVLRALGLPPNSFGFFLASTDQGFVAAPGGSQGNLCLGGAIGRYVGPGQIQNSGAGGTISLAIDNMQVPQPTGSVAIVAGETWNFQLWSRDISGSNFTDGYEVTFN